MEYIAVDCGKYDTKVCRFTKDGIQHFKYRTKLGKGVFEDDMLKRGTLIAQVDDGEIYMFGYGAPQEPVMETSKKTETHKIAALVAIATALGEGRFDDVAVAIGVPLDICNNVKERLAYKEYILGSDGQTHTVKWKADSNGPVLTTVFTISKRFVYPEGCGALWLYPEQCRRSAAIIDIGNLNTNCIYAEGLEPDDSMCFTGELGGKSLISSLAQALETETGCRVVESIVAQALAKPASDRHLVSAKGNKEIEDMSGKIIAEHALQHVRKIKQQCDVHHWPLDFAQIICVGGTVKLLTQELTEVFGENIYIPDNLEYVNVEGFLRRMCASLNIDIFQK